MSTTLRSFLRITCLRRSSFPLFHHKIHPRRADIAELNVDIGESRLPYCSSSLVVSPRLPLTLSPSLLAGLFSPTLILISLSLRQCLWPRFHPSQSDAIDGASPAVSNPSTGSPACRVTRACIQSRQTYTYTITQAKVSGFKGRETSESKKKKKKALPMESLTNFISQIVEYRSRAFGNVQLLAVMFGHSTVAVLIILRKKTWFVSCCLFYENTNHLS